MPEVAALADARRAFLIAPAGYGKTELVARAVLQKPEARSLVLTHTHAGVEALRRRLKERGAPSSSYEVETIAGWSLRLAAAFPRSTGVTFRQPKGEQWGLVYGGAANLLTVTAITKVVRASFDGVYVDEYQDCTPQQHEVIVRLAEIVPVRVLGDPLQGIFDFGGREQIVCWDTHVRPSFDELPALTQPRRWERTNPALGRWLACVRRALENRQPIDIRSGPDGCVNFTALPDHKKQRFTVQREVCAGARCGNDEYLLAIHAWPAQCHKIARQTGGRFTSPETIECEELFSSARRFDEAATGPDLARATFDFSCRCLTQVQSRIGTTATGMIGGRNLQRGRIYNHQRQLDALKAVIEASTFVAVRNALVACSLIPNAETVRDELFEEMLRALKEYNRGSYASLEEAALRVRDRTRRTGRKRTRFMVSRTLLMKGLEFDHVILLDADALDRKNLYVALTRASRSLRVLATSPVLNPRN